MTYQDLKDTFCRYESRRPELHLTACIIFSPIGPNTPSFLAGTGRSFLVSSNNKAFRPGTFSKSIYGYQLSHGEYICLNDYIDGTNRIPSKCRIVRYDLACIQESPLPAQSFWSCDEAVDALFRKLIEDGFPSAENMKASYEQSTVINDLYRLHIYAGKLSRMKHGWQIRYVPLDDPNQVPMLGGLDF